MKYFKPRLEVEELIRKFISDNDLIVYYNKDTEGKFVIHFACEEEKKECLL